MSLKEKIERELKVPIRLRAGAPGSLKVLVNGQQIFSKKEAGRSPGADELLGLIRQRAAAG